MHLSFILRRKLSSCLMNNIYSYLVLLLNWLLVTLKYNENNYLGITKRWTLCNKNYSILKYIWSNQTLQIVLQCNFCRILVCVTNVIACSCRHVFIRFYGNSFSTLQASNNFKYYLIVHSLASILQMCNMMTRTFSPLTFTFIYIFC